jgi:hypothetical protein
MEKAYLLGHLAHGAPQVGVNTTAAGLLSSRTAGPKTKGLLERKDTLLKPKDLLLQQSYSGVRRRSCRSNRLRRSRAVVVKPERVSRQRS